MRRHPLVGLAGRGSKSTRSANDKKNMGCLEQKKAKQNINPGKNYVSDLQEPIKNYVSDFHDPIE